MALLAALWFIVAAAEATLFPPTELCREGGSVCVADRVGCRHARIPDKKTQTPTSVSKPRYQRSC